MKRILAALLLVSVLFTTSCLKRIDDFLENDVTVHGEENTVPHQNEDETREPDSGEADGSDTTAKPEENIPPKEVSRASFIGCGDNIIYYGTWRDAASKAQGTGREYSFRHIYKNVESIISSADIAFINQETVCSQSFPPESYPQFNSPVDLTYDIANVGFDVVSLANNHMLDKGALGLYDSFNNWNDRGLHVIGAYEEKEDGKYVTYYEKNGIKVAFVAYTEFSNLYEDPANKGLYASFLKNSDVAGDIAEADANADIVIVSVHWGDEGSFVPNDLQRTYAQTMADSGADVIIGHHPHVIQPIEWLEGKDGGRTLCAYSLGNFVHEQARDYNVVGGMLSFDMVKYSDGTVAVEAPLFTPTACHFPGNFYDNTVYLLESYTEELCNSHAVRTYYNNSISLATLKKYVTDTISEEFLPDSFKAS